jgi:hypothetical protein
MSRILLPPDFYFSMHGGECQTDAWGISAFDALSKKGRFIFYSHMASSEFRAEAVQGTEQYARRHAYSRINTNALNAITLSLRATNGSVPARRSAAFQHAGVAISPHKQEIASSFHSSQ